MKSITNQPSESLSSADSSSLASGRVLRRLTITTLILLAVQYLLGMTVNLFVTLPASHPGTNADNYFAGVVQGVAWAIAHGAGFLQLHATLGLVLLALAIALLVLAIRARRRAWIVATTIGLLTVLGAGFNGASFLNYNHDFSSMIMASLFLIAVCAYATALYITR